METEHSVEYLPVDRFPEKIKKKFGQRSYRPGWDGQNRMSTCALTSFLEFFFARREPLAGCRNTTLF